MSECTCKICHNEKGNQEFVLKEMMFGFQDEFIYFWCSNCECLQIKKLPENMSKYYPQNYYSFNADFSSSKNSINSNNPIRRFLVRHRDHYAIFNKGFLGMILYKLFPNNLLRYLALANLSKESRILDVGCGSGKLLNHLKALGFKNVMGIDPYIEKDIINSNSVKILKKSIHDIEGEWDLIMFHHSFEHIADPLGTLYSCKKLLSFYGICLIRVPVMCSWMWENYKENWINLDAPRHFFIHSEKSIKILADKVGLNVKNVVSKFTFFQLWGSEQCKKGIPLRAENSYRVNPKKSIFSKKDIEMFRNQAKELERKGLGDQNIFYISKVNR